MQVAHIPCALQSENIQDNQLWRRRQLQNCSRVPFFLRILNLRRDRQIFMQT